MVSQHNTLHSSDFCVIGGGIVGLCSAIQLQSQGVSVTILDADYIGQGASWGNAGHLAVEQVFAIADPSVLYQLPSMLFDPLGPLRLDWQYLPKLFPWAIKLLLSMQQKAQTNTHEALKALNGISLETWRDFSRQWQLDKWVHIQGSLLTAETPSTLAKLYEHGKKLSTLGVVNHQLDQGELLEREPALAENQLGALFFPNTGHISDLSKMIATLKAAFIEMGGVIYEQCAVKHIQVQDDGVALVTTQHEMKATHIMISAGAFSKPLAYQATGVNVALDTERGYHLMLPNEIARLSIPVTSMDRRFIMTPMNEGLRLAGTVEFAGLDKPANMQRAYNLLKLAKPMFKSSLNDENKTPWMGFRPSTCDSLPVIDKIGRVFLNFGHQHLGLTQAVASAMLISDLYFDKPSKISLAPYRLERFGKPTVNF